MISYLGGTFRVMRAPRRLGIPSSGARWPAAIEPGAWIQPLGAASDGRKVAYTDYAFDDGYTYRQFTNGDITILKSPRSTIPVTLPADGDPKQMKAWRAITADIAKRKKEATVTRGTMLKEDRDAIIRASGTAVAQIIGSFGPSTKAGAKKKHKKKGKGREDDDALDQDSEQSTSTFPFVPVAVGGSILLILGVVALSSGGSAGTGKAKP